MLDREWLALEGWSCQSRSSHWCCRRHSFAGFPSDETGWLLRVVKSHWEDTWSWWECERGGVMRGCLHENLNPATDLHPRVVSLIVDEAGC